MFKSSIWITLLTLSGSGLGFLNQVAIANYFGASREVDLYLASSATPVFFGGMISSIISYSVVPKIAALSACPKEQSSYIYSLLLTVITVAGLSGIVGCVSASWMIAYLQDVTSLALIINRITWGIASLQIIISFLAAISLAFKHYVRPSLAGLFPYLGMLFFTVAVGKTCGIVFTALGLLIGTFASMIYLGNSLKHIITPCIHRQSFAWVEVIAFYKKSPFVAIAMSCFSIYAVVDAFIAPQIGESALSYLGYSQRILIGIGGLVIAGPSAVIVPNLSRLIGEGRLKDFRRESLRALGVVIMMAVPLAVCMSYYSIPLVRLFFLRGAFDEIALAGVADVLAVMVLGMIPMLGVVMLFRIIYCLDIVIPQAFVGLLWAIMYPIGSLILMPFFGTIGIAYAYSGSWLMCFILCFGIFNRGTRIKYSA